MILLILLLCNSEISAVPMIIMVRVLGCFIVIVKLFRGRKDAWICGSQRLPEQRELDIAKAKVRDCLMQ